MQAIRPNSGLNYQSLDMPLPALPTVQFSKPLSSSGKFRKLDTFLKKFYEFDGV